MGGQAGWPVRTGAVPSLDDGISARPETASDLGAALVAGAAVVLVPERLAGEGPGSWLESCGKTQLAAAISRLLWRSHRVELLVWADASSRASVLAGYAEAAAATGTAPGAGAEAAAGAFAGWLRQTGRPWLVVLDNLRDPAALAGLWPAGPAGRVLVTAASTAAVPGEHRQLVHPVGILSPGEALAYLTARLGGDRGKCQGAEVLAADLGYEPLALAQASAVISSLMPSCQEYRQQFARTRERVISAHGGPVPAAAVSWAVSLEQAALLAPDGAAGALLDLASLLAGDQIPGAVLTSPAARGYLAGEAGGQASEERARAALAAAARVGLVRTDVADGVEMVRMSGAGQAALRAAMPDGALERAVPAAADALLAAWPGDEHPPWLASALRACTGALRAAGGDLLWAGGCHPVLTRAGRSLDAAGLTSAAVEHWSGLAAAGDQRLGRGHPDTLAIDEHLAAAYLAVGRTAEAAAWLRWVLTERVRLLGPDHPASIGARRDLGRALVPAGQLSDAIPVLERAVGDYRRVRGAAQSETLGAQEDLAAAYQAAGRFADAARLYQVTLTSREHGQGEQHPGTIATRYRLAAAWLADGRYKAAVAGFKRVLADRERAHGAEHPDTVAARRTLGSAYYAAGRMASAVQSYEQAYEGGRRVLGDGHPGTLATAAELANAYETVGRVTDAITLLRDALARCEQEMPPDDPLAQALAQRLASLTAAARPGQHTTPPAPGTP